MSRRNEQRRYALVFPSGYFEPFARFQKRTNFSEKPVFTQVKNADEECNAAGKASLIVAFVPRGGSEANQRCCGDVSKPGVRPGSIVASQGSAGSFGTGIASVSGRRSRMHVGRVSTAWVSSPGAVLTDRDYPDA
jgi:hypothetical protein